MLGKFKQLIATPIALLTGLLAVLFMVGVLVTSVHPYGETGGLWTASEKRQVISLLERIEENTR